MLRKSGVSIIIYLLTTYFSGLMGLMPLVHAAITDLIPPIVRHTPPTSIVQGDRMVITAIVEDESDISWVNLWYRATGKGTYNKVRMDQVDSKTWKVSIWITQEFKDGIEYYIDAVDQFGNEGADGTRLTPYFVEQKEVPPVTEPVKEKIVEAPVKAPETIKTPEKPSIFKRPLFWAGVLLVVGGAVGIGGAGSGTKDKGGNDTNVTFSW